MTAPTHGATTPRAPSDPGAAGWLAGAVVGRRAPTRGLPAPGREDRSVAAVRGWVLPGREPPVDDRPEQASPLPASARVRATVVVAVRDRAETVAGELDAVLARLGADDELVVVDDASGDATAAVLAGVDDGRVRRFGVAVSHGRAWATNLALHHAWGRVVVVPDDLAAAAGLAAGIDEFVASGALAAIHEPTGTGPGAIGGPSRDPGSPVGVVGWRNAVVGRVGYLDAAAPDPAADWRARLRDALVASAVVGDRAPTPRVRVSQRGVQGFPERREPVTVTMASMPSRRDHLERVVATLVPQADRLCVHLNGYDDVPAFLDHPRIVVTRSQDLGDLRDNGKFAFGGLVVRGHHVVVDDDIDYSPDHVDGLIAKVEQYDRRAIVGYHGVLLPTPVTRYFGARTVRHFGTTLREDEPVHLLGSGTVAMHTDTLRIGLEDLPTTGMADVWLALAAHRAGIPMIAVSRPSRHLRQRRDIGATLFEEFNDDDRRHVEALRTVELVRRTVVPAGGSGSEVRRA